MSDHESREVPEVTWWAKLSDSLAFRLVVGVLVVVVVGGALAEIGLRPSLSHLHVRVLSGSASGNYHSIVDRLHDSASKHGGRITNVLSEGSLDNVKRLSAARATCSEQFALVQAGMPWPDTKLELIGRLPKAESVFILGRDVDKLDGFRSIAGMKIGVGSDGSGTARIAEDIAALPEMAQLGLKLVHGPTDQQIDQVQRGEIDLVMLVIDEDAPLIVEAVRERGLQILSTPNIDVVARRFAHLRAGRIGAGQFDPVKMSPPSDRKVLRVDTLVVGNGCARRSQTLGLLTTLNEYAPDFMAHNRETGNRTGLTISSASRSFFEHQGLDTADEYLPWLVDYMPASFWVNVALAISVLFNVMNLGNRFRLWRIDAARMALEDRVARLIGPGLTPEDIERLDPAADQISDAVVKKIDALIGSFLALEAKSRRHSLSLLSPMGQEMSYRYQENLMLEFVAALRAYRARIEDALEPARS